MEEKIEIAVLCNYPRLFKTYVENRNKENENYTMINNKESCTGKVFDKVFYTTDWHDMDNFYEVEDEVKRRIRKNK